MSERRRGGERLSAMEQEVVKLAEAVRRTLVLKVLQFRGELARYQFSIGASILESAQDNN